MTKIDCDVLVIGGGMAGASLAAHLAETRSVTILEMEDQPGFHSTGRSAALFSENYGNETIRALSRASRPFFVNPPAAFCSEPIVGSRPVLTIARSGQEAMFEEALRHEVSRNGLEAVDPAQAMSLCPVLRREGLLGAIIDHRTADIEVHALHHGYIKMLKSRGGALCVSARVLSIERAGMMWIVHTAHATYAAQILVNAAGAWADRIGEMAHAQNVGLLPCRRTAALVEAPDNAASDGWPMILDIAEQFYMKPDAGLLLISPADETPAEPGDVQADEMDIAIAVDRLQRATTIEVRRIKSKWAGLRSFVADRSPVVGFDERQSGFFWMAALGGYGIQTAPALGRVAANILLGRPIDDGVEGLDLAAEELSPLRLEAVVSA